LESQIINGDGDSPELEGVLTVSGTQAQAWSTDLFETPRKAVTKLQTASEQPTYWALNPADVERIDLAKDAEDRYYGNGPWSGGPGTVWSVPVIATPAVPAGTGGLGDWRQSRLYVREDIRIDADKSGTLFTTNQIKLRGEGRFGFSVLRPQAFVVADLTA